jgi:hypothetical protein
VRPTRLTLKTCRAESIGVREAGSPAGQLVFLPRSSTGTLPPLSGLQGFRGVPVGVLQPADGFHGPVESEEECRCVSLMPSEVGVPDLLFGHAPGDGGWGEGGEVVSLGCCAVKHPLRNRRFFRFEC